MEDKIRLLISELGEHRIKLDCDLSEHLYTKLGSKVTAFYIATSTRELVRSIELCRELRMDFVIIGSGTKMAISQEGFSGLAIKNRSDNLKIFGIKGKVSREGLGIEEAFVEAESGVSLKRLAEYAALQKLTGFEHVANSLGTVGGSFCVTPDLLTLATGVNILTSDGKAVTVQPQEVSRKDIILSVTFKLKAKR